ncbi:transposase [Peribacillus frigoritolerans]|uniref:transposase n=1 Tax=Peribacillus frigoritolerans TaxID=450367 RepID=UPI001F0C6CFF|nr:transposase [Peribacillus frigoritolerans]
MEAMIERCAGLDVHQETVVACVLFGPLDKKPKTSIETFSTTTTGLLALSDWLATLQVSDVVMESISDIFGVSGRRILEAILNGEKIETDGLRKMVDWRTKASITDIASAINGRIRRHHRDMLRYHWEHMSYLEKAIEELEKQIDQLLSPYRKEVELLDGIPGVNKAAAATFIAEMGVDMSVFKSAKHLASWAGVSPGNYESAGKKNE